MIHPYENSRTRDYMVSPKSGEVVTNEGQKLVFLRPGTIEKSLDLFIGKGQPEYNFVMIDSETITPVRICVQATTDSGRVFDFCPDTNGKFFASNILMEDLSFDFEIDIGHNDVTDTLIIQAGITYWHGHEFIKELEIIGVAIAAELKSQPN